MKEVDFETAVKLSRLGFNEKTAERYSDIEFKRGQYRGAFYPAPRLDDAIYWLEDNFHFSVRIEKIIDDVAVIYHGVVGIYTSTNKYKDLFAFWENTREEAFETAIGYILDHINEIKLKPKDD